MDVKVQLQDGEVFDIPLNENTTSPTGYMYFVRDVSGKVYEVNAYAVKTRLPYDLGLMTTAKILRAHQEDSFFGAFIYGDLRSGKSVYALHALSQVYGVTWVEPNIMLNVEDEYALPVFVTKKRDWYAFKKFMVFLPEEFQNAHEMVVDEGVKAPLLVWDDAGVWLNKHEHTKEWARKLMKQLQVIGSSFASIMFTSPNYLELLKGIREMPGFRWGQPASVPAPKQPLRKHIIMYMTRSLGWKKWIVKEYVDFYDKYDQDAYNAYYSLRKKYLEKMDRDLTKENAAEMLYSGEPAEGEEEEQVVEAPAVVSPKPKRKRARRVAVVADGLYQGIPIEDVNI